MLRLQIACHGGPCTSHLLTLVAPYSKHLQEEVSRLSHISLGWSWCLRHCDTFIESHSSSVYEHNYAWLCNFSFDLPFRFCYCMLKVKLMMFLKLLGMVVGWERRTDAVWHCLQSDARAPHCAFFSSMSWIPMLGLSIFLSGDWNRHIIMVHRFHVIIFSDCLIVFDAS